MTTPTATPTPAYKPQSAWVSAVGYFIFFSRWLQAPLYVGLIIAQLVYVVVFMVELWHLAEGVIADPLHIDEATIMLAALGLIDVVMIANLLIMVIIGGYETFVSRIKIDGHPDQPEWLSHVNANVLKVKLAMAIIGISSIHLLKTFIEAGALGGLPLCSTEAGQFAVQALLAAGSPEKGCTTVTSVGVMWQTIIHTIFILSALGIAATDKLMAHAGKPKAAH